MTSQDMSSYVIELTQKLVRCQGGAGDEKLAADLLAGEMRALGYDRVAVDENGSVLGIIEGRQPGPTLLLDGHLDTVGVAPGLPWSHEPFGGQVVGAKLYGRGATDMKGPLAAATAAAAGIDRSRISGRVAVSGSVMEEVLEGVALKTVMDALEPDFVVICEPSDLVLITGSRGRAEIQVETLGKPAHSSRPQEGINAVQAMLPVIQALEVLPLPVHPTIGRAILALTEIISEPYPAHSVIPSRCRATYDRRLVPGETQESVLVSFSDLPTIPGASVSASIAKGEYSTYTGRRLEVDKWFPAWEIERGHPLVRKAAHGLEAAGLPVACGTYQFCTNAAYSAGVAQTPTIGYGPSQASLAHVVDEYILIDELLQAVRGYEGIILSLLGV